MAMSRVGLLLAQMDEVSGRLRGRLEGLGDEEYFWEPVPGCWTVRRDPSGTWVAAYTPGEWGPYREGSPPRDPGVAAVHTPSARRSAPVPAGPAGPWSGSPPRPPGKGRMGTWPATCASASWARWRCGPVPAVPSRWPGRGCGGCCCAWPSTPDGW